MEKKFSHSESLTLVFYILMRTSPQKIKIFGRGNQKLFKFSIWLIGQTECTALTLLSKTDWKSRLKRCNFWFPRPNILIFWREVLQRMYKTVVKLSEREIFFLLVLDFSVREWYKSFFCSWNSPKRWDYASLREFF